VRLTQCCTEKPAQPSPASGAPRHLHIAVACDELGGLVYACCLVRPNGIDDLKPKSVVKKMKDKGFARGVHREAVHLGIELIGLPRAEHVGNVIDGLKTVGNVLEVRGVDQARRRSERTNPGTRARDYGAEYSDESFWKKLTWLAARAGRGSLKGGKGIVRRALVLHYCLKDDDTPAWARHIWNLASGKNNGKKPDRHLKRH